MDNLNQEELLHLAVESIRRADHGAAISYLKQGLLKFPDDAKMTYVLGAELAQIGLFDQAEQEMERAISLDPELYTAVFQLGLLRLTLGKLNQAKEVWGKLEGLDSSNSLRLFKDGLLTLVDQKYAAARELIERGISFNTFSPELNQDMQNVISQIPSAQTESIQLNSAQEPRSAWLTAYKNESDE